MNDESKPDGVTISDEEWQVWLKHQRELQEEIEKATNYGDAPSLPPDPE